MYKWRHLIEHCFAKLKEFRRIATRYDKIDRSFAAMIYVAATIFVLTWTLALLRGSWNAFARGRLAYFRLKWTKSITPVATAAR
jgi:hypothetical protein